MKSVIFSLFSLANAVMVTETAYATFYVTVGPNQQPTPSTSSIVTSSSVSSTPVAVTSPTEPEVPSSSSSSSVYVVPTTTESSSEAPAPAPTTSSVESTTTPAVTTSSTTPAKTTSSAPAATTTSSGLSPFQEDIVNYHNRVRAQHHVGDVTWSDELADFAKNYLAGDNCVFKHSGGPYGENIAIGYATIDDALDAWYNEEDQYNYAAGQFGENTGHFTQMVWKGTSQVGCATQDCSGRTFLVCEYKARGNIIGHFTENVFPK